MINPLPGDLVEMFNYRNISQGLIFVISIEKDVTSQIYKSFYGIDTHRVGNFAIVSRDKKIC